LAVVVGRRRQLEERLTAKPGLLFDLAERAFLVGLAGLDLALRKGPVAPLPSIDEQHLGLAALVPPRDHTARRSHHAVQRHALVPRFSSLRQRRGICPRISARRAICRSSNLPATNAAAAPRACAASSRTRACATTAS